MQAQKLYKINKQKHKIKDKMSESVVVGIVIIAVLLIVVIDEIYLRIKNRDK